MARTPEPPGPPAALTILCRQAGRSGAAAGPGSSPGNAWEQGPGDASGRGNGPADDPLPLAAGVESGHSQSGSVAHGGLWKWSIRPIVFIFSLLLPCSLQKGAPGEPGPSGSRGWKAELGSEQSVLHHWSWVRWVRFTPGPARWMICVSSAELDPDWSL